MRKTWQAFCAAVWAIPLAAHSLYIMPQKFDVPSGETIVVSVHNGDSFPAGDEAPDPSRLMDARLVMDGKVSVIEDFRALGKATHGAVRIGKAGAGWLAVRTRPRTLQLEAAKFERYLREEGLEDVLEWRAKHGESQQPGRERYSKYAKSLIVSGEPRGILPDVLGMEFEFVLEADPSQIQTGGLLPVRLLWHGKPARGVQVERAWSGSAGGGHAIAGRTGSDGRIRIPLDRPGKWRLHAVAMERAAEQAVAEWESYWASVTFEWNGRRTQPEATAVADDSAVR
jgi:hypothetical protein